MTGFAFDANILIDALGGFGPAQFEISRAVQLEERAWISRMAWIEVLSKGAPETAAWAEQFLSAFGMDEIDSTIAARAAALRRDRPRLKSPDAIILASAQVHDRVLVTRNTKDFSPGTPGVRIPYSI